MSDLKHIAIGMAVIGLLGSALSLGKIFSSFFLGIARNPSAEEKMSKYIYVGAAFAESIGLFCFVLALLLMFT